MTLLNSFSRIQKGVQQVDTSQSDLEKLLQLHKKTMATRQMSLQERRDILQECVPLISVEALNAYVQIAPTLDDVAATVYGSIAGEAASKIYETTGETVVIDAKGETMYCLLESARNVKAVVKNAEGGHHANYAGAYGGYADISFIDCKGNNFGWNVGSRNGYAKISLQSCPGEGHFLHAGSIGNAFITFSNSPGKHTAHDAGFEGHCYIESDSYVDPNRSAVVLYTNWLTVQFNNRLFYVSEEQHNKIRNVFERYDVSKTSIDLAKGIVR